MKQATLVAAATTEEPVYRTQVELLPVVANKHDRVAHAVDSKPHMHAPQLRRRACHHLDSVSRAKMHAASSAGYPSPRGGTPVLLLAAAPLSSRNPHTGRPCAHSSSPETPGTRGRAAYTTMLGAAHALSTGRNVLIYCISCIVARPCVYVAMFPTHAAHPWTPGVPHNFDEVGALSAGCISY
jgi:hypothetical protein